MRAAVSRNDDLFNFDPSLRGPLVFSVLFHILVVASFMIGLPIINPPPEIYQPISVELVQIDKITQTNKVAPPPKKVDETKPEQKPPENKLSPPEVKEPPKAEEVPKPPEPKVEKEPEPKKEEPKPKPPEEKPKEKPKPPEPKKEEVKDEPKQEEDFNSLLKNLAPATEESIEPSETKTEENATQQSALANLSDRLTMSEEDALRRQLGQCWNIPAGAKYAEELVVEVRVIVNPDKTVQQTTILDQGRYNRDPVFRAAADAARRAFQNPLCIPLELPDDGYQQWKTMTIRFDPREML